MEERQNKVSEFWGKKKKKILVKQYSARKLIKGIGQNRSFLTLSLFIKVRHSYSTVQIILYMEVRFQVSKNASRIFVSLDQSS